MPVAVSATPAAVGTARPATASAPADRYFGKLKMSALRIRYETMQLAKRYHDGRLSGYQTLHLLALTEDAFEQWARLYPKDPWLPSTAFAMARLYQELPGEQSRGRAVTLYTYVKSTFPQTPYGRQSRDALHRGVSVKPAPSPAPQVSIQPSATSSTSPSPAPAPSPTATPTKE